MPIISIVRDVPNNVSLVRIATTDTLATVATTNYILNQMPVINDLNKGVWGWFISDTVLVAAVDGNALYEFTDSTFSTLILLGGVTSGTVLPGLANQIAVYPANGNQVDGSSTLPSLVQVSPLNLNHATGATTNTFYAGDGTWKTVAATTSHSKYSVYVAQDGNDSTGNGSINAPFLTVAHAMSTITTNSITNPFSINLLGGTITDTLLVSMKPFVSIIGSSEGVIWHLGVGASLDASWGTTANATMTLSNFNWNTNNISLDFSAFTNSTSPIIYINNVFGSTVLICKGSTNNNPNFFISDCVLISMNYSNCFVQLDSTQVVTLRANSGKLDANLAPNTLYSIGCTIGGAIIAGQNSGPSTSAIFYATRISTGGLTGDGSTVTLLQDVSGYVSPTLLNSAVSNLVSISNGLLANYTPVNYTPVSTAPTLTTSVQAHLHGIDNALSAISSTSTNYVYVSSVNGVDSVGRGGVLDPYATISFALSQITTATSTNVFVLECYGKFTETNLNLKPFIYIDGNNSSLSVTNPIGKDAAWGSSVGSVYLSNIALDAAITLNLSTNGASLVYLSNVTFSTAKVFNFTGSGSTAVSIKNCSNPNSVNTTLILTNCVPNIRTSSLFTLSIINNVVTNPAVILIGNNFIPSSSIAFITSGTAGMTVFAVGNSFSGTALDVDGSASSGSLVVNWDNTVGMGSIGIGGTPVNFSVNLLSVTPTFFSGASDSNITYNTLSASVLAGFSPTNYTASNPRVKAHLQGIDAKLGTILPATNSFVYVYVTSTGGVDAVGNGSILRPYATIAFALTQITDNSVTKRYMILCFGNLTETTISLKPWVLIQGNSSSIAVTTVNLDSSFSGTTNALCYMDNFTGLTGPITLDFTGSTTPRLLLTNLRPSSAVTWTITGPAIGTLNGIISRNFGGIGLTTPIDLTVTNFDGEIINNCLRTTSLSATGAAATHSIFLGNNIIVSTGSLTVQSTSSANINVNASSSFQQIPLSLTNTSTGSATFACTGGDGFNAVTLTGTLTAFTPDLLSVTPTFASGAVDGTNILYPSLGATVTAGFSPTNYTAANTRVKAHLQGIDTKLGAISPATNPFISVYVASTGGVDSVGNGSILKPYATITFALSQITDNTTTKRYIIYCNGVFTDSVAVKPWVLLQGNGSLLTNGTCFTLDSSFNGTTSALCYINNFIVASSVASTSITLDFTSTTTPRLILSNLKTITTANLTVTGPTSGVVNGMIYNNISEVGTANFFVPTFSNFAGYIYSNSFRATVIQATGGSGAHPVSFNGNTIISGGSLLVQTNGSGTVTVYGAGNTYEAVGLTVASTTGVATFISSGCGGFNSISVFGSLSVFTPDLVSVAPTFTGGATAANVTYASLSQSIKGTTTNDNAPTGGLGEYISSSVLAGSAVSLTTATPANVTSISLTAGDWLIGAMVATVAGGTTITTQLQIGTNTTTATLPTIGSENNYNSINTVNTAGITPVLNVGPTRLSLSGTTTVFLVAQAAFTVSTLTAYGFIGARRIR